MHNFNYDKALEIQSLQLSKWASSGIKPEIFKQLLDKISDCNAIAFKTKNAFDIVRGESISNILNEIINKP